MKKLLFALLTADNYAQVTKVYLKKETAARVLMEEHEYGTGGLETYAKLAEVDGDGAVTGYAETECTYDSRGRMTYDGVGGVTIDYNYLNLPRKISGTGGTFAKYSYLANGSKTEAENGSGAGLVYPGSLIYKKASNGTLTFDGARSSDSTSPARKTRPLTSPSRSRTSVRDSTARPSAAGWFPIR